MSNQWHRAPIVLVEDEPHDVLFTRHALAAAKIGNPLMVFRGAEEARHYLATSKSAGPAVFILDFHLDGPETGLDFLGWLRCQPSPLGSTPPIMLTASDDPSHHRESLNLGAIVFLQKPVMSDRLVEAVQTLGFVVMTSMVTGEMGFRIIQRP